MKTGPTSGHNGHYERVLSLTHDYMALPAPYGYRTGFLLAAVLESAVYMAIWVAKVVGASAAKMS